MYNSWTTNAEVLKCLLILGCRRTRGDTGITVLSSHTHLSTVMDGTARDNTGICSTTRRSAPPSAEQGQALAQLHCLGFLQKPLWRLGLGNGPGHLPRMERLHCPSADTCTVWHAHTHNQASSVKECVLASGRGFKLLLTHAPTRKCLSFWGW